MVKYLYVITHLTSGILNHISYIQNIDSLQYIIIFKHTNIHKTVV